MPAEATETGHITHEDKSAQITLQKQENPTERKYRAFTGIDAARDYNAMYRAAFEFHRAHNPPTVDREYWKTHTPGEDDMPQAEIDYWERYGRDTIAICRSYEGDPFIVGLLCTIGNELTREYKAARAIESQG